MVSKLKYLVLILLLIPSVSFGTTYTVCSSGCDYTTVQAGVNAASAGDTVSVGAGTYMEAVVSHDSGTSDDYITINGAGITTIIKSIKITHNYNKVSNIKFYGATTDSLEITGNYNYIDTILFQGWGSVESIYAVKISGDNNTIINSHIRYWGYRGGCVWMADTSATNLFENNIIEENISGSDIILLWGDGNIFKNNTFKHITNYGIPWAASENLVVPQSRRAVGATSATCVGGSCYWGVTTAGITGSTEPEGFAFASTAAPGDTITDGTVVWTLKLSSGQHPDLWQTYSSNLTLARASKNHIIDGNICIENCNLSTVQISNLAQGRSANIKDWIYRNNIFRTGHYLNVGIPGIKFYNNLFIGPAISGGHPINNIHSTTLDGTFNNEKIKNNAFIGWEDTSVYGSYSIGSATYTKSAERLTRANNTAYTVGQNFQTATPDGWHYWECTTAGTTAGSEPAGYSIIQTVTGDIAKSTTITNINPAASTLGITADYTDTHPHYWLVDWTGHLNYQSRLGGIDTVANTLTDGTPIGGSYNVAGTGVSIDIVPDCTYKTITVTDGDAVFTCRNGAVGFDTDYNVVAKEDGGTKAFFAAYKAAGYEVHGISGGNHYFTNYNGTTKEDFIFTSASSVLKGTGVDLTADWADAKDMFGTARPNGSAWDIGPYQSPTGEDTTAPTLLYAFIATNGDSILLTFNEPITSTSGAAFTLDTSGAEVTLTCPSVASATTMTCTTSRTVLQSETTALLSYTGVKVTDIAENALAAITNKSTENGSTEGGETSYTLTITKGSGITDIVSIPSGVNCGATCTPSFAAGTALTISAGCVNEGWKDLAITGDCASDGTVTMSAAKACTVACTEVKLMPW